MMCLRKWTAVCLLLAMCLSLLCACTQEPQTSQHTEPTKAQMHVTAPVPYTDLGSTELLRMMCYCPCNTLSAVAEKGWLKTFADVMALGEKCPIIAEFLSRPYIMDTLANEGYEIYQEYKARTDTYTVRNALGLGQVLRVMCPHVFERNKETEE